MTLRTLNYGNYSVYIYNETLNPKPYPYITVDDINHLKDPINYGNLWYIPYGGVLQDFYHQRY